MNRRFRCALFLKSLEQNRRDGNPCPIRVSTRNLGGDRELLLPRIKKHRNCPVIVYGGHIRFAVAIYVGAYN